MIPIVIGRYRVAVSPVDNINSMFPDHVGVLSLFASIVLFIMWLVIAGFRSLEAYAYGTQSSFNESLFQAVTILLFISVVIFFICISVEWKPKCGAKIVLMKGDELVTQKLITFTDQTEMDRARVELAVKDLTDMAKRMHEEEMAKEERSRQAREACCTKYREVIKDLK